MWKFCLPTVGRALPVEMPRGARVVHVAAQADEPCLWAEVDPVAEPATRSFRVRATGEPVESTSEYLGSVHLAAGRFVGHVYEEH